MPLLLPVMALPLSPAPGKDVLSVSSLADFVTAKGRAFDVPLRAKIQPGYHVNSHQPTDEYIIPLKLTWTAEPLEVVK